MGVLPKSMNVKYEISVSDAVLEQEGFCEYAYDFEKNNLKTIDGRHYYVYGNKAMEIWIYKCMLTSRFRYSAYSDRFGTEVYSLVGEVISSKLKQEEIKRYIVEAVMVHPFMKAITDIILEQKREGLNVTVDYQTVFNDEVVRVDCIVPIE